jgi:hypothetical protein
VKFSAIQIGARAERTIELPDVLHEGKPVPIILRPLTGIEEADALRRGYEFAAQGNAKAEAGDPIYDLGVMVHTLAVGCLDPDSSTEDRKPFFDGGAEQILKQLGRETIHFLYQRHELWQDECSPYTRNMSANDLMLKVAEVASSIDDGPFTRMSPATRWIFTRTTARLLLDSREDKSVSGEASSIQ